MEAGLMEIVRSVNISWIYDTYFSLYRANHPGKKSGGIVRIPPIAIGQQWACLTCYQLHFLALDYKDGLPILSLTV